MVFLQLPSMLPAIAQPADSENNPSSSKGLGNNSQKLQNGITTSRTDWKNVGVVKLKIGDALYDVKTHPLILFID